MTKRLSIAFVAFLMLFAACGREGSILSSLSQDDETPRPGATSTPVVTGPSPSATGAAATATPTAPGGATAAPQTEPVAEGGVNTPKDGRYTYTYSGESTDPFNPSAPPERFSGELVKEYSHQDNVYTEEQTNSETPGRFTTRTRWEATKIFLLSFSTETAGGDFRCTFDPPLTIANIPIKPGTIPTQNFKGEGNACNGKLDITVERKEDVKDAAGRTWSTWRTKVRIETGNSQFTNASDETTWLSPELGVDVRSDGVTNGEIRTPTGSQKFSGKAASALKSNP